MPPEWRYFVGTKESHMKWLSATKCDKQIAGIAIIRQNCAIIKVSNSSKHANTVCFLRLATLAEVNKMQDFSEAVKCL